MEGELGTSADFAIYAAWSLVTVGAAEALVWHRMKHLRDGPRVRILTAPALLGLLVGLIPTWVMFLIAAGKLTGCLDASPHDRLFTVWKDVTVGLTQLAGAVLGMVRERRPRWRSWQEFAGPCVYAWVAFMIQVVVMLGIGFLRS